MSKKALVTEKMATILKYIIRDVFSKVRRRLAAGLFVGRFQPFHLGHLVAVQFALEQEDFLCIVVGSAEKSHQPENPFTAGERVRMIKAALDDAGVDCRRWLIIPVPDAGAHAQWIALVNSQTPRYDVVFSNEPLTLRLFQEMDVKTVEVPYHNREDYSATEVRRRMVEDREWEELLPKSVSRIIHEIDGVRRLKALQRNVKKST